MFWQTASIIEPQPLLPVTACTSRVRPCNVTLLISLQSWERFDEIWQLPCIMIPKAGRNV